VDLILSIVDIFSSFYCLLCGDIMNTELFPLFWPTANMLHFLTMTDLLERGLESENRDMESCGDITSGRSMSDSVLDYSSIRGE
jgi:hypothetical protein